MFHLLFYLGLNGVQGAFVSVPHVAQSTISLDYDRVQNGLNDLLLVTHGLKKRSVWVWLTI